MEEKSQPKPTTAIGLSPRAACGSFTCGGCYEIEPGIVFHSPRAGYDQSDLIELDKEME